MTWIKPHVHLRERDCSSQLYREKQSAAAAGEAADPLAIPPHHQAVAVVLDFVDPRWPGPDGGRVTFDG